MIYLIAIGAAVIFMSAIAWQRGKRRQAVLITGIPVLIASLLVFYDQYQLKSKRDLIDIDRVALVSTSMKNLTGSTYSLSGRIQNQSDYQLVNFGLKVSALDCPSARQSGGCIVIGETSEDMELAVPPGQARDFNLRVSFGTYNLKPRGVLIWDYEIVYTRGN